MPHYAWKHVNSVRGHRNDCPCVPKSRLRHTVRTAATLIAKPGHSDVFASLSFASMLRTCVCRECCSARMTSRWWWFREGMREWETTMKSFIGTVRIRVRLNSILRNKPRPALVVVSIGESQTREWMLWWKDDVLAISRLTLAYHPFASRSRCLSFQYLVEQSYVYSTPLVVGISAKMSVKYIEGL